MFELTIIEVLRNPQRLYILPRDVDPRGKDGPDLSELLKFKVGVQKRWMEKNGLAPKEVTRVTA